MIELKFIALLHFLRGELYAPMSVEQVPHDVVIRKHSVLDELQSVGSEAVAPKFPVIHDVLVILRCSLRSCHDKRKANLSVGLAQV